MQLRSLAFTILFLMLLFSGIAWGANTLQGNNGNPHNLSADNTTAPVHASTETRVCVFCHTPHGASANSVLWNRANPSTPTFPLYAGGNALALAINDPAGAKGSSGYGTNYPYGATRMCMSCHDGATAIGNVLVGGPIATTPTRLSDLPQPTLNPLVDQKIVDLNVAHPVSFNYTDSMADINTWYGGGAYGYGLTGANTPLENGKHMQCTTCHDPHLDTRGDAAYGGYPFWRQLGTVVTAYDQVCNNCHIGGPLFTNSSGAMQ